MSFLKAHATMRGDVRRHFVIAIYGVGNPAPGEVERSLSATLRNVANEIPFDVHEFDWNQFAPQAPRATNRLWRYAQLFSGSFASAAWFRSCRPTRIERVRTGVDATIHAVWAATQAFLAVLVIAGIALYLVGAASDFFSNWESTLTRIGAIPGGVGGRASLLAGHVLTLAVYEIQYGAAATAALLVVSVSMAALESIILRSTRPLAVTARRHTFLLLLVPCVLLSLVMFRREDRESVFDFAFLGGYWVLMGLATAATAIVHFLILGGSGTSFVWSLLAPGTLAVFVVSSLLLRFLRGHAGPTWLAGAKVLLDIGLYVGTPSYRATIQDELTRMVVSIPERSTTAIWIVAHSLGSVIALDSLTNSAAWLPTDRVRLVTLGSPIRRFFNRFFPGAFFEPQIDAAAQSVAERVGEFIWLNSFRRFDYIGTALRFRQSGLDLPTGQLWPAHANYWSDGRVARTIAAGFGQVRPIQPLTVPHTVPPTPPVLTDVPDWIRVALKRLALPGVGALSVVTVAAATWLVFTGVRDLIAGPAMNIRTSVATTARVRHQRGFSWDGLGRIHEFRFDFRDESTGREHRVAASVVGFFGLWSDPRFDYRALARFIRADCQTERVARFYEFGWSVPCSRDAVPIAYEATDPNQFIVVGFEDTPGFLMRVFRAAWKAFIVAATIVIGLAMVWGVALLWYTLWKLFVGEPDAPELAPEPNDAVSILRT